jgi:protein ImuB
MLWLCIHLPQLPPAALTRLAAWAYQWSSHVSLEGQTTDVPSNLWLELSGSGGLFGSHATLITNIETGLAQLRHRFALGVAPTPAGAALLARAAADAQLDTHDALRAWTLPALRAHIAPLPLALLALAAGVLHALHGAGLRTIGQVLSLPAAALARRFGPDASRHLQQLLGEIPDPRPAWQLPQVYRTRVDFDDALHDTVALLFPLQRLLQEFQGYLRATDRAVQRFTLQLLHRRAPATRVEIGLSQPGRDAAQLTLLVRERLGTLVLAEPITALIMEALEFVSPHIVQTDFFGTDAQKLQDLRQALDRLTARLGPQQVQRLQLRADHRPEYGAASVTIFTHDAVGTGAAVEVAAVTRIAGTAGAAPQPPPRPCWLLPEPRRIPTPTAMLRGPERIEGGWWDGDDITRDYYVVRGAAGERLWVFQDLHDGRWYLQGLWA